MATTEPRPRIAPALRAPLGDRLALVCATRHPALLAYAGRYARGEHHLAEDWVNGAYQKALAQADELADRDDGFLLMRLHDHIRLAARAERRRRQSAAHPHATAPCDLEAVAGGTDPAERAAERAEAAAYWAAVFALPEGPGRSTLVLQGLGYDYERIAFLVGAGSAGDARSLACRARARALEQAALRADGILCRRAQRDMQAALEGRLPATRARALEAHLAENGCGCRRIYRLVQLAHDRRHLGAFLPPALILPAAGGAVADVGVAEAGLHGLLGLSRLTYLNEMAGIQQVASWLGSIGSWAGRPWQPLAAMALSVPLGARRGPARWLGLALAAVAALFLLGSMVHGFPGGARAPQPAPAAPVAVAETALPGAVSLSAGPSASLRPTARRQVRLRADRQRGQAVAPRQPASAVSGTRLAAPPRVQASYRPSAPSYRRSTPAPAPPAVEQAPLSLEDAFTPGAGG